MPSSASLGELYSEWTARTASVSDDEFASAADAVWGNRSKFLEAVELVREHYSMWQRPPLGQTMTKHPNLRAETDATKEPFGHFWQWSLVNSATAL